MSGCECESSSFDGHHEEKFSQTAGHSFMATQHKECVISVTIVDGTSSGERKV